MGYKETDCPFKSLSFAEDLKIADLPRAYRRDYGSACEVDYKSTGTQETIIVYWRFRFFARKFVKGEHSARYSALGHAAYVCEKSRSRYL